MSRGIGAFGPIRELLPDWMAVPIGLLTQLGDVWFLTLVVALAYLLRPGRREDVAVVVALTLTGYAAIDALKRIFALPRPDRALVQPETLPQLLRPVYEVTGTAGGYGFPSGHAFMTTIVYLSLVDVLSIGTERRRRRAAVALVAVVCLSRIALGVHYLVDVVAGVGFGLLLVVLARKVVAVRSLDSGTAAFGLAVVASLANLLHSDLGGDAVLLAGASLGAFAGWQLVVSGLQVSDRLPIAVVRPALARSGTATAILAMLIVALVYFPVPSSPALGATLGLVAAGVLVLPAIHHSDRDRRAWVTERF